MKDIGLKLKEKREQNGVTIEEAAEDLKVRPKQIESLEAGIREDFKDVAMLKYLIRDYAKYLGLDGEMMVDDFNEYLFDFTSKIPVGEIEKAKENNSQKKDISSPYTAMPKKSNKLKMIVIVLIVIVLIAVIGYFVISGMSHDDFLDDDRTYIVRR